MRKKANHKSRNRKDIAVDPGIDSKRRSENAKIREVPITQSISTIAAIFGSLVTVETFLNFLITNSAFRNSQVPFGARLGILFYDLVGLTVFLVLVAGFVSICSVTLSRIFPAWLPMRRTWRIALLFLVWLAVLLYGASWAKLWHTGKFLSRLDFAFIFPHPIQVFHWIDHDVVIIVLGLTIVMALALSRWIPRWIANWQAASQRRLVFAAAHAVAVFVFGALLGELYSGFGERQYARSAILYANVRDDTAGPFANALSYVRRYLSVSGGGIETTNSIKIISRQIIPMKQYLAGAQLDRANRWNVILLIIESMRADQLKDYGGQREVMPALEALAREARVFSNAYTQATHTDYATVVPLSSHYPLRSTTLHAYPKDPTYPRVLIYDILRAVGYRTAVFSSSNEFWSGMINYLQTGNIDRFFHAANFKGPTYVMEGDTGLAEWVKATKHAGSVDDRFTVAESIRWLDSLGPEPFFMYLNFQNSHVPYVVPNDFPHRFSPAKIDFPIRFGRIPEDKIDVAKDVYADSLAYVDAQIARLFQYLKAKGLWSNTIIIVTSDHGQAFYEHGFAGHASAIYNEVMKVPLIVRAPGLTAGIDPRPAQHVDVLPSVLDLLSLPPHPSSQGVSLLNPNSNPNRAIYLVAQTPLAHQYGIVQSGHKLIYDENNRQYVLYDLASDPGESRDVAPSNPSLVRHLVSQLQTWRKLQIDYYSDRSLHSREYPPVITE